MIIRLPDTFELITSDESFLRKSCNFLREKDISLALNLNGNRLNVSIKADTTELEFIKLRWNFKKEDIPRGATKVLGDEWERAYGTMEWHSINPDRFMPWYFFVTAALGERSESGRTSAFGVRVRPNSFCFWNLDGAGVTLWMDIRSGGKGVILGGRTLDVADVVFGDYIEKSAFEAARDFCGEMCDDGIFPKKPVYGSNNWYYAYGKSSHEEILRDASIVADYTKGLENRPFMVIDDGWQPNNCDGPWHCGNERFPDMKRLASEIAGMDVLPGIWIRLLVDERRQSPGIKEEWRLVRDKNFLDPSHPEVIEHVKADVKRLCDWGYKLIKHDYSTADIFGTWGCFLTKSVTDENADWSFYDRTRTGAEIVLDFYRAIKEAAGDALIIGCDTLSHLCAGLVEINRTGDDTSGKDWLRTRKFGVNTLAFRLPQNGIFYAADADCVGITELVPWEKNRLWLKALSISGSPLFVSCKPFILSEKQAEEVKEAFAVNSIQTDTLIPLDWTESTCPQKWLHNGKDITINWFE